MATCNGNHLCSPPIFSRSFESGASDMNRSHKISITASQRSQELRRDYHTTFDVWFMREEAAFEVWFLFLFYGLSSLFCFISWFVRRAFRRVTPWSQGHVWMRVVRLRVKGPPTIPCPVPTLAAPGTDERKASARTMVENMLQEKLHVRLGHCLLFGLVGCCTRHWKHLSMCSSHKSHFYDIIFIFLLLDHVYTLIFRLTQHNTIIFVFIACSISLGMFTVWVL